MKHRSKGRPKLERSTNDHGTPELQKKRQLHHTEEVLDGYLRRGIITQEQHWCGMHLRWLYTKRYGLPTVKAHNPENAFGRSCFLDDDAVAERCSHEFAIAMDVLNAKHLAKPIMGVSVFNIDILQSNVLHFNKNSVSYDVNVQLIDGMDALIKLWCTHV